MRDAIWKELDNRELTTGVGIVKMAHILNEHTPGKASDRYLQHKACGFNMEKASGGASVFHTDDPDDVYDWILYVLNVNEKAIDEWLATESGDYREFTAIYRSKVVGHGFYSGAEFRDGAFELHGITIGLKMARAYPYAVVPFIVATAFPSPSLDEGKKISEAIKRRNEEQQNKGGIKKCGTSSTTFKKN